MTADRPYRAALPADQAVAELERMSGTQFDPEVVRVFTPLAERLVPLPSG
jgi:HD-GYP domain-containing protein (c-di-GMP phosphodiesterase class II)